MRTILGDIQKATNAAVMATEQTSKAVENRVKQSFLTKPFQEEYLSSHIEQILSSSEIPKTETIKVELEVLVRGRKRVITVDHQQILTLLISTYEAAVQRNDELVQAQGDLKKLNDRLEALVAERTAELSALQKTK